MEAPTLEEDVKQFDSVTAQNDEDSQPDPDETLLTDLEIGRAWLIPRFLMERWSSIDAEGVHLASIRVYHNAKSSTGRKPRIVLTLPPNSDSPDSEGDQYELDIVNDSVDNQLVIAEREKHPGTTSRARQTFLTGRVKHECNLRPVFTDRYRQRLKQRAVAANTPKKQIMWIEEAGVGGRGNINMLTSGVTNAVPFSFGKPKPKPAKGQFERMARMPRDQLLDGLFRAFQEREHWSIKVLRERTQQPEAYLKEVLSEIAFLHRSGEHNGTWELLQNFKGDGIKAENVPGPSFAPSASGVQDGIKAEDAPVEDDDDNDDDDEDEDDMEEVS
ncbi:uncharacterized protein FIBRA_04885 [Fibroporia radiculosa]|uniref:Transcription initiation factor IIF subunit beta n=1 Tax=Fibroporia radiculosa TaxID=599839 RepID=J4HWS6_9APHY|nr:uncharacterized protein FIBRA_04885 [Fibroporia radiculosa]CCM02777.1 predicted protein [Fibroporia radiculosa]